MAKDEIELERNNSALTCIYSYFICVDVHRGEDDPSYMSPDV